LANIKSAIKRIRQDKKRHLANRITRSEMRTYSKKAVGVVADGNVEEAAEAVRLAISKIDKAVKKGVLHANAAARRKSRLAKQLNTLQ
jgi:small subunit ribosomal protein S20